MDLSFARFDRHAELCTVPGDLAVLMVGVAARQAASRTAMLQASLDAGDVRNGVSGADPRLFAPLHGAFNGPMAAAIVRWSEP